SIGSVWASEHSMLGGFGPIVWPLDGMFFGTIVLAVLGVNVAAGEYSSGMIRLTLAATPRRGEVLLAKIAVVAAVSLVAGFVATFAMFLGAQAVYAAYGVPTASLSDPDALRAGLSCAALT